MQTISIALFAFLLLLSGYLGGRMDWLSAQAIQHPIRLESFLPDQQPTVHLDRIIDGQLTGSIRGNVQLFVQNTTVTAANDGTFTADPTPFLVNYQTVLVPKGARYVASKRGSKYYDVHSKAGQKLKPTNRIYFESHQAAEAAGYRK